MSILRFGVTERKSELRGILEEERSANIEKALKAVVGSLQAEKEWVTVSTNRVIADFHFGKQQEKYWFEYCLKRHPNVICRIKPSESRTWKNEELAPATTPLQYKWVEETEKAALGFDAVFFRNIPKSKMRAIKNLFTTCVNNVVDILCVIDALFRIGADKCWSVPDPLKLTRGCGIPMNNFFAVIDEMLDKKAVIDAAAEIITVREVRKKESIKLVLTGKERETALEEKARGIIIKVSKDGTQTLQVPEAGQQPVGSGTEDISGAQKSTDSVPDTDNSIPGSNTGEALPLKPVAQTADIAADMPVLTGCRSYDELGARFAEAARKTAEELTKVQFEELVGRLAKADRVLSETRSHVLALEREVEKQKSINGNHELYKQKYREYVQNHINQMMGEAILLISQFSSQKHYAYNNQDLGNKFRADMVGLLTRLNQDIAGFSIDDIVAPSLVK